MGLAADRFYGRLAPLAYADPDSGYPLRALATALMAPRELFEVARDADGYIAWGKVLDPDACPAELLDWLAVFAGVVFPPFTLTEADKRARIKRAAGYYRASNRAIMEEVLPTLTGTQYVNLIEQASADPWALTLITRPAETPDAAATLAAGMRQKRAGIALTHVLTNNVLWVEGTKTWSAVLGAVTWANVVPGDV